MPKIVESYEVLEKDRMAIVKDWITWVVRDKYGHKVLDHLSFKTKIMTALALRKPKIAVDSLIVNNNWTAATALASF